MNVLSATCTGMDVISAETIMNPVQVTEDDKGKSNVRSPEVVTFLLSLRYMFLTWSHSNFPKT